MKLLLDTHLLLWSANFQATSAKGLSAAAVALIEDPANEIMFSAASLWEIAIKAALARADFAVDPRRLRRGLVDNGYVQLPINSDHALAVAALPDRHKDPFDRMLIAQATVEGIILLTSDAVVASYPGPIRKV
jgi:PIN domain nuclease of toxin-antitoxin system